MERSRVASGASAAGVRPPGLLATGLGVVRNEGVLALWSGLGPSLARGTYVCVYMQAHVGRVCALSRVHVGVCCLKNSRPLNPWLLRPRGVLAWDQCCH